MVSVSWWSEFRDHFSDQKYWLSIIWNDKDIRINEKPVFCKTYYNSGIHTVSDLSLNLDNMESFKAIGNKIEKVNFLTWTGLRHSIPSKLKQCSTGSLKVILPSFTKMIFFIYQK